ncbi:hypothetical protein BV898_13022 [Hypsibius exemplaris]|uniref:WAP domain-containing protein n=1 Tax=Hypsibius exemplaris TaxID=2072580 RepID=A0A1W0WBW3_HYPEX|nr:hypothetical protein BV898_13022 [Hypsibius exemplaris]
MDKRAFILFGGLIAAVALMWPSTATSLSASVSKFGDCPVNATWDPFVCAAVSCLPSCRDDSACPGTRKCCDTQSCCLQCEEPTCRSPQQPTVTHPGY